MACMAMLSDAGKEGMGKKDIGDREYFSDHRRFAELINYMLYKGMKVVLPENLVLQKRKYLSLSSAGGELERDILMKDVRQDIYYGMELETESDYRMPERVITYDACEYEFQVKEIARGHRERSEYADYREKKSRIKEDDKLLPIITVVLYLGEGHWKGKRKQTMLMQMPFIRI